MSRQCGPHGRAGQVRGPPIAHRASDDQVGEQVLDRAALGLAFCGRLLGQVLDPRTVRLRGGEVPAHYVIVLRWAGRRAPATLLHGRGPQVLLGTQTPRAQITDLDGGPLEIIGQEPVTEDRIFTMGVDQGVYGVRVLQVPA